MKSAWQLFKKHPISIIAFTLLLIFWCEVLKADWRYTAQSKHLIHSEKLAWGESIMYGYLFAVLLTVIFIVIMLINAVFRKNDKFYYKLILFVVVPLLLSANIYLLLIFPFLYIIINGNNKNSLKTGLQADF
jgi:uncharacterized membrane protein